MPRENAVTKKDLIPTQKLIITKKFQIERIQNKI
jgi:hypothetical protein